MPTPLTVPGPHYSLLLQLLRTSDALWNSSRIFFARWDISPSQFNILNLLVDSKEGLSQTELSQELIMHRSNVTGLIDRLEARGLVKRNAIKEDRRAYRVRLTDGGRKLIHEILPEYHAAAEDSLASIPLNRARQIMADLQQITKRAGEIASRNQSAQIIPTQNPP